MCEERFNPKLREATRELGQGVLDAYRQCYGSAEEFSDGHHTFKELYDHRIQNWITVCRLHFRLRNQQNFVINEANRTYRAKTDPEWFLLGIVDDGKQLSYHLPMHYWDECSFAVTLDKAPTWDGHTSQDVLDRLKQL